MNQTNGRNKSGTWIDSVLRQKISERLSGKFRKREISDLGKWRREYPDNPEKSYFVGAGVSLMDDIGIPYELYEKIEGDLKKALEEAFDELNPEKTIERIDIIAGTALRRLFSKHMRKITN